jgi:Heterokaryon incompatibility protein (HET)
MSGIYHPLNKAENEIRLLTIQRGRPDSPISCKVANFPFGDYSKYPEGVFRWSDGATLSPDWQPDASVEVEVQWVPEYEALSYTWGDPNCTRPINANGVEMQVTTNLFAALRALRQADADRVLWVDALCIDQKNTQERSDQVQRMRSIYQRAQQTVMWLGDSDESSDRAIEVLEKLNGSQAQIDSFDWPEDMLDWNGPNFDPCYVFGEQEYRLMDLVMEHLRGQGLISLEDLDEADWVALEDFLVGRRYWSRLWVVQEVANSRKAVIRCGSRSMGLDTLKYLPCMKPSSQKPKEPPRNVADRDDDSGHFQFPDTTKHAFNRIEEPDIVGSDHGEAEWHPDRSAILHSRFRRLITNPIEIVKQRWNSRHWSRLFSMEDSSSSLLNVMENFRDFQTTDPRDKVYALLGLASVDRNMPLPKPDYSKSVSEVYCETVRAIIRHTADLSVLCLSKALGATTLHKLPSWVPDWTTTPDYKPIINAQSIGWWKAAGETLPRGPDFHFDTDSQQAIRPKLRPWRKNGTYKLLIDTDMSEDVTNRLKSGSFDQPESDEKPPSDPQILQLEGFILDSIDRVGEPIPNSSFENGDWKRNIMEWEKLMVRAFGVFGQLGSEIREIDPGLRHPKLGSFVLLLFKGVIYRHDSLGPSDNLIGTYIEHYLVWTNRLRPEQARVPIIPLLLRLMSDYPLKDSIRGWKPAITRSERLALVPGNASDKDAVVIMFGADVPLLLRPAYKIPGGDETEIRWMQVGTAFVEGCMVGDALETAEKENLKTETFVLR